MSFEMRVDGEGEEQLKNSNEASQGRSENGSLNSNNFDDLDLSLGTFSKTE